MIQRWEQNIYFEWKPIDSLRGYCLSSDVEVLEKQLEIMQGGFNAASRQLEDNAGYLQKTIDRNYELEQLNAEMLDLLVNGSVDMESRIDSIIQKVEGMK